MLEYVPTHQILERPLPPPILFVIEDSLQSPSPSLKVVGESTPFQKLLHPQVLRISVLLNKKGQKMKERDKTKNEECEENSENLL